MHHCQPPSGRIMLSLKSLLETGKGALRQIDIKSTAGNKAARPKEKTVTDNRQRNTGEWLRPGWSGLRPNGRVPGC